jgi:hypothetical protein
MNELFSLLSQAYELIRNADKTDIDAYYLAVEEAQGFIAEALDLAEHPPQPDNVVKLDNIDAMSDELYDALDIAFKEELERQGKSADVSWQFWNINAEYEDL